ncbi:ATP-binding protein [Nocardiopsis sp. Huas11]|uniref:ATP-binding protein n=1 Tax=Nocardiopsis sp. Huas11 TaxID=2183912 RepID=UPI001F4437F5|nr:ATP-binding protein [Nocardiopsis sp. Huas11]
MGGLPVRVRSRRLGVSSAYFDGRPDQVGRIRDWSRVATGLERGHTDSVELVVSELVTNAVRHSASGNRCGRVRVTVETLPGQIVLVSVTDDGPRTGQPTSLPRIPEQADDLCAGGRGLQLVHELSEKWWWTGCAGSPLTVWALIDPHHDLAQV